MKLEVVLEFRNRSFFQSLFLLLRGFPAQEGVAVREPAPLGDHITVSSGVLHIYTRQMGMYGTKSEYMLNISKGEEEEGGGREEKREREEKEDYPLTIITKTNHHRHRLHTFAKPW